MSRVRVSLPSLVHGVSQLSAAERQPVHALGQDNCWPSVEHGSQKRPPLIHVAKIDDDTFGDDYCHGIDRGSGERYIALLKYGATTGNGLVFDLNGTVIPVFKNTGTYAAPNYLTPCDYIYLASGSLPAENIRALSVLDYTFITNRAVAVTMASTLTTAAPTDTAHIFIKQAAFAMKYVVKIQNGTGTLWTITASVKDDITTQALGWAIISAAEGWDVWDTAKVAPPGAAAISSVRSEDIGELLLQKLNGAGPAGTYGTNVVTPGIFTVTRSGNVLKIIANNVGGGNNGTITLFEVSTSQGSQLAFGIQNDTSAIQNLPLVFTHNYVVKIKGNLAADEDDFWLKFTSDTAAATLSKGTWSETAKPGIAFTWIYTASSLHPHALVRRTTDNSGTATNPVLGAAGMPFFTFEPLNLDSRVVGDTIGNPNPGFVSRLGTYNPVGGGGTNTAFTVLRKVQDMAFFRDRLCFVCDENVSCSEEGSYFNFFRTTVRALPDSDPIDVAVSSDKASVIHSAVPFAGKMILFSSESQTQFLGSPNLTPSTVEATQVSRYQSGPQCRPLAYEDGVYFINKQGTYSGLRSLTPTPNAENNFTALDLSIHTPSFIEGTVKYMTVTTDSSITALVADGDLSAIYVLKQHREGTEIIQSAWTKFIAENATIRGIVFFDTRLYVICERGNASPVDESESGDIVGWGLDNAGQIIDPPLPPALPVGVTYTELSSAHNFTMAIRSDNTIVSWGLPLSGQGTIPGFGGLTPVSISAGNTHCLAVMSNGSILGWGSNAFGEATAPALPGGVTYTQCSGGNLFSLALRSDGNIVAFGVNANGVLSVPVLPVGVTYTHCWAGYRAAMACRSDGAIVVWGTSSVAAPAPGSGLSYTKVSGAKFESTPNHFMGLLSDGTVACWGNNTNGECNVPSRMPTFIDISGGQGVSAALGSNGIIHAWGTNYQGASTPTPPPANLGYIKLAQGDLFGHGLLAAMGASASVGLYLEYIDLSPGIDDEGRDYWLTLDRRVSNPSFVFGAGVSTITMPYDIETGVVMEAVDTISGIRYAGTVTGLTTFTVAFDLTGRTFVAGHLYVSTHAFHKPQVMVDGKTGKRLVLDATSAVLGLGIRYEKTSHFKVKVGSQTKSIGSDGNTYVATTSPTEPTSGNVFVGVGGRLESDFDVSAINDTPFPHTLVSAEWLLNANIRSATLA